MTRVVITGAGVVSPVGTGVDRFWSNLTMGQSGIGPIDLFDTSSFPVKIGGQARDFDLDQVIRAFPWAAGVRDRKVYLGLAAAREALTDSELSESDLRHAVLLVGVGLEILCLEDLTQYANAPDLSRAVAVSMTTEASGRLLQTPLDTTTRLLGDRYGLLGGRYTNCSACAAGTQVLGEAWHLLREGRIKVAVAGATDSMLNPLGLGGFSLLRVLSAENDQPTRACRPFDATRKGTVLGEGAAFVTLETLDHALNRHAKIYAEILGYGSSMDAFRISDPDPSGSGAVRSMTRAMNIAGLRPEDIDCVNAHGTGTPKNDSVETAAIKETLGSRAYEIPVHSIKSMTGHMIAASGTLEALTAALTLSRRRVPPTLNLTTPDPECDLDYVSSGSREFTGETVLSNSFGFGGQNATLILGRYTKT
jgi:3-oxoacyl-[acyl-carrier-protein] synthase II